MAEIQHVRKQTLNRRRFLQASGLTLGGALLAACAPAAAPSEGTVPAGPTVLTQNIKDVLTKLPQNLTHIITPQQK